MKQIFLTIDFLFRLKLCSFWNCISRAETLPGIVLKTDCFPRKNCWDVLNYKFKYSNTAELYEILVSINKKYKSIRIEDRIIREFRDRIKIELFYNESTVDFLQVSNQLEDEISILQKITLTFIKNTINNIVKKQQHKIENEIIAFITKFEIKLNYINNKFNWLL